jgi:hypothetical protein
MTCYNSELPIGPPGPTGPQGPQGESAIPAYKVYTALLTQAEETAPTAIELENTLGDISFTYGNIGNYFLNSSGLFTINKTTVIIGSGIEGVGNGNLTSAVNISVDNILISTTVISIPTEGVPELINTNGLLYNTLIEIRVYN